MALARLVGAPVPRRRQNYTFALVPKNMNNPFFDQARDGCKKAEAELAGKIECLYIGPRRARRRRGAGPDRAAT